MSASTSWPSRSLVPCTRGAASTALSIALRQRASSRELAETGNLCSSTVCTRLQKDVGMSKDRKVDVRTDVGLPDRRSLQSVCPSLDAVAKSERIVVFAEDCATQFLDGTNGRF